MKIRIFTLLLCFILLLTGCKKAEIGDNVSESASADSTSAEETQGEPADLGDDNKTFGDSLDELGVYIGYFEEESTDIVVECVSGTKNAYTPLHLAPVVTD